MKNIAKAWIALILLLPPALRGAAQVAEEFDTDPVTGGRFLTTALGTESAFLHGASNGNLTVVLDVDYDPAFYLSSPFAPFTTGVDASFSLQFRITALDNRVPPSAFFGLLTTNHVALGGDGTEASLVEFSCDILLGDGGVEDASIVAGADERDRDTLEALRKGFALLALFSEHLLSIGTLASELGDELVIGRGGEVAGEQEVAGKAGADVDHVADDAD